LIERIEAAILAENKEPEPAPVVPEVVQPTAEPQEPEDDAEEIPPATTKALVELDKWRDKSEKAGKLVTWHAVHLPTAITENIKSGDMSWVDARESLLPGCGAIPDIEEHKAAPAEIMALAAALNRIADGQAQNVQTSATN